MPPRIDKSKDSGKKVPTPEVSNMWGTSVGHVPSPAESGRSYVYGQYSAFCAITLLSEYAILIWDFFFY